MVDDFFYRNRLPENHRSPCMVTVILWRVSYLGESWHVKVRICHSTQRRKVWLGKRFFGGVIFTDTQMSWLGEHTNGLWESLTVDCLFSNVIASVMISPKKEKNDRSLWDVWTQSGNYQIQDTRIDRIHHRSLKVTPTCPPSLVFFVWMETMRRRGYNFRGHKNNKIKKLIWMFVCSVLVTIDGL